MLFAAGFGTRMGALTKDRPKPMVQVQGRPLIDYALDLVHGAEISRVAANVHYLPDQVRAHLAPLQVAISDESDEILETGGGLRKALPLLGTGPVFTLNTDAVWQGEQIISRLGAAWDPDKMSALLLLVPTSHAVGYRGEGDFSLGADGRLARGKGYVYTGLQIIDPAGLADVHERAFSLNLVWDKMLAEGRLFGTVLAGRWCDVGRPDSIPLAEAMLRGEDV
jgi:MurNAc alpha-1-phosphate uridylyltransferase